jgi:hypothetical protein
MVGFLAILLQDFKSIVEHGYFKRENLETQVSTCQGEQPPTI